MNTLIDTLQYFVVITLELIVLFIGITAIVEFILMHISEEKMKKLLSGKGLWGNIIGSGLGSVTPFCACSTIPMTVGFLNAKVPFGATMSFLIASPLVNPIIIGMLAFFVGVKAAAIYFLLAFILSVFFGFILEKTGFKKYIKNVRVKGDTKINEQTPKQLSFKSKIRISLFAGWSTLKPVLIFLLIGVAIGAVIYGYMPDDFVLRIAGPGNIFAVPVAALVGVPLYIRAETAIPIALSLVEKGMGIGTAIALIIGGAGMAIPEMSMLAGIFKIKLVAAIVTVIFLTAVISGFVFNIIL
ncbi:MAG: permease [Spirochaetia bacterium]|nr:permease [Spirochaetia bacterium]